MPPLLGRRVLITGASSGVGAATAEAFALAGADVVLLARRREGLEVVAGTVRSHGRTAHVICADVTDRAAVEAAVAGAEQALGGLDVVVSNAAGMLYGEFTEVAPEDFDRTIATTFTGAVDLIRASLAPLERTRGSIVVVGSIMARVPLPTFTGYTAAKHALRGFVNTLRIELRRSGSAVSISMVHPGGVDTPLWDHLSSANPNLARNPPDLYSPETIADAIVACAIRPRAEFTVGGEARLMEMGWAFARPIAEPILSVVSRYYASRKDPAPAGGLLREPVGDGRAAGGRHGRPSLWKRLRLGSRSSRR